MQIKDKSYREWLSALKDRILASQLKAALTVNAQLLQLYWELGQEIVEKEQQSTWGDKWLHQLSKDLSGEVGNIKGFSHTNLKYIRRWYLFYNGQFGQQAVAQNKKVNEDASATLVGQQAVAQLPVLSEPASDSRKTQIIPKAVKQFDQQAANQIPEFLTSIPWGHHLQIITKCKDIQEALFYVQETTNNNWSRSVLVHQIESKLYKRKGKALTNFENTLPKPQSDLANELLKNPYQFDFLNLSEEASERDLENALADHLTKFLLELGTGFAYMGRQYQLKVDDQDFFIDLLFYHAQLHCYVVVELKIDEFKPEYAGKLNFYLNAVDDKLKHAKDEPTIGLLLCKKAGKLIVEYSLKNIGKPIGVSEYKLVEALPKKLKGNLPTIEDIESELTDMITR